MNQRDLVGADGLRIGIIPTLQGKSDLVKKDDSKNLIVCPLPYDGEFMQIFYEGWEIVQQFIKADGNMPKEVYLPRPDHRRVAQLLVERREFPVLDVIEALGPLSQPHLIQSDNKNVSLEEQKDTSHINTVIAPKASII